MIRNNKKSGHIKGLDGLRGIAVIGVVLYHIFPNVVKGGYLGVAIFFILSGYLIAITSESAWEKQKFNVKSFYNKRIKRIYPALIIMVVATAGMLTILNKESLRGIRRELCGIFFNYNNWWQIMQSESYFTKISNATPYTHL